MKIYSWIWIFYLFSILTLEIRLTDANLVRIEVKAENADITDFTMQVKPLLDNITDITETVIEEPPILAEAAIGSVPFLVGSVAAVPSVNLTGTPSLSLLLPQSSTALLDLDDEVV